MNTKKNRTLKNASDKIWKQLKILSIEKNLTLADTIGFLLDQNAKLKGPQKIKVENCKIDISNPVSELKELLETYSHDIELVSFGLAPNPSGFCYELSENHKMPASVLKKINTLLNVLNEEEEEEIKNLYLRV